MKKINQKFSFCILKTFTEKILLTFFLVSCSQQMFAQVYENFSDGNFTADPTWSGNDSSFTVTQGALQLVAKSETSFRYLTTPSQAINQATWMCNVRFQFNPSSSNFARFYIASDQANLNLPLNGYFVLIGNTTDDICLYKQTGTTISKIIDGPDGVLNTSNVNINFKVTRDGDGNWALFSDLLLTGDYIEIGRSSDVDHLQSLFSGVYCRFTATRSNAFFFDDITITGSPYIPPPSVEYKDIVITEIFADPSPSVELPEEEFIEIYNRSDKVLSLAGLVLTDGSNTAEISHDKILPGEFIILCGISAQNAFAFFGKTIGLNTFPSLNNAGEKISLLKGDKLIDLVQYSTKNYRDKGKSEGGRSLELIDINNPCGEENNWSASESDSGGTPGKINSIAADRPDHTPPQVMRIIPSDTAILIVFNERLQENAPSQMSASLEPHREFGSIEFNDDRHRSVVVKSKTKLQLDTQYSFTIENSIDCSGNTLTRHNAVFELPKTGDSTDVVLNEILFNPRPTGVDFVEIVNASKKYINIKHWAVAEKDSHGIATRSIISEEDMILKPNDYLLLTTDANITMGEYINSKEENFLVVDLLPPMNDDEGQIVLIDANESVIDEFTYAASMHSPFIKNDEGVSLERINLQLRTQDENNWKSAASNVGFATPGSINSMHSLAEVVDDGITITPEVFVPVTGSPDFAQVNYRFNSPGFVANIKVLDAHGRAIRTLANNAMLGVDGFIRWDGDRDDGYKASVGSYMVHLEVFDSKGNVSTYRKRVAIGY